MIILTSAASNAVVMEGNDYEILNGWPLGLGNINSRITAVGTSRLRRRCSSFSSFSSSNLDTESTASFFPDQSVPLGRLIGIKTVGGNKLQISTTNDVIVGNVIVGDHQEGSSGGGGALNSQGICSPLLHHVIGRIFRRPKLLSQ